MIEGTSERRSSARALRDSTVAVWTSAKGDAVVGLLSKLCEASICDVLGGMSSLICFEKIALCLDGGGFMVRWQRLQAVSSGL